MSRRPVSVAGPRSPPWLFGGPRSLRQSHNWPNKLTHSVSPSYPRFVRTPCIYAGLLLYNGGDHSAPALCAALSSPPRPAPSTLRPLAPLRAREVQPMGTTRSSLGQAELSAGLCPGPHPSDRGCTPPSGCGRDLTPNAVIMPPSPRTAASPYRATLPRAEPVLPTAGVTCGLLFPLPPTQLH